MNISDTNPIAGCDIKRTVIIKNDDPYGIASKLKPKYIYRNKNNLNRKTLNQINYLSY